MSRDISLADLCKDEIRYTYFLDSDLKMQFRVTNYTSLKPLGDRVLTKIKAAEEKSIGGILLPSTSQTKLQGGDVVVVVGEGRTIGDKKIDIGVKAYYVLVGFATQVIAVGLGPLNEEGVRTMDSISSRNMASYEVTTSASEVLDEEKLKGPETSPSTKESEEYHNQSILTEEATKAVKELLLEIEGSLSSVCSWPDEIKWMNKWRWTSTMLTPLISGVTMITTELDAITSRKDGRIGEVDA
ncbi:20 kDa chaperonin, chloroplastic-like protein [Tanacetum coccineum]|uniref:20 kDa chaperonin, chloroplastic-like protein n=1 Tax=Tanacetum coccineum TaxID=301880 RepID=A0ABQ5IGK7_9ASTR